MGRHRHVTCVRSDGLSAVLRPLLDDRRIVAATLVDAGSGLILDGWSDEADLSDLELLGAGHADLMRAAPAVSGVEPREVTVETGDGRHHLLHAVPDPHGDRLVVAVVVRGGRMHVGRARRRLRDVSVAALTAGPTLQRRPVDGAWLPTTGPEPVVEPVAGEVPTTAVGPAPRPDAPGTLLSAMAPGGERAVETPPRFPSTISSVATSPATSPAGADPA